MELIRITLKAASELHCDKSPVFAGIRCKKCNVQLKALPVYANAKLGGFLLACGCVVGDVLRCGGETQPL